MSAPARPLALAGLLFILLLVSSFLAMAAIGAEDGAPAAEWGAALQARGQWAQLSGYLHALAGLSLAAFVWALHASAPRGLAPWGRFAGMAWASTFVLGGIVVFSAAELAGYQDHAEGAKTALVLGHLLYANPIAALLGNALAIATGLAAPAAMPSWFRRFSLLLGGLGAAVTLLGSVGGIGLLGMGPLALWLVVASVALPWGMRRARDA